MLRVGLTGGIACGKSTVAGMLRERGCRVLDADAIAHRVIEPGQPAYGEILEVFGEAFRTPSGGIDRTKLGAVVFADRGKLERLNRIVHPRVAGILDNELREIERREPRGLAIVEAALLIESNYHRHLDRIVVTWCTPTQQIERLLARGMTAEQAERRIAAQMPLEEKRRAADDEIDCSGSVEHTREQVENLVTKLRRLAAA